MTEKIKKWINSIRWKYFTNQQAGYTQQAVYDELNMYNAIIEKNKLGENGRMTEKEELLKLLKENRDEMNQLQSELRTISSRLYDAIQNYKSIETGVKRVLNTEEHGNCHLNCEYYKKDSDTCYNYLMGVYTGLAFEVSRLDKCIADVIKEHENRSDVE